MLRESLWIGAVVIFQNHLSRPCNILTGNYPDKKVPIPDTPGYPFTTALSGSSWIFADLCASMSIFVDI